MIKRIIKFIYILLIFILMYLPLILIFDGLKINKLFSNTELLVCVINSLLIGVISSLIIGILSYYISKYLLISKKSYIPLFILPLILGIVVYIFTMNLKVNPYIMLVISYVTLLTPIISYLELLYLRHLTNTKSSLIKSFGKMEFIKLLNDKIIIYYYLSFIIIYSDSIITSFIFNTDTHLLPLYLIKMVKENNYTNLSNALLLSFGIIFIISLIIYMVSYERRLRGRYEKDN